MKRETKKITQGAMIVAMLGILFVIDRQSAGIFNYVAAWFIPLPFVVYAALYGLKDTIAPYIASVFLALILATPALVIYTIMYGAIGLVYGYGVSKRWEGRKLFFVTIVGTSIIFFVTTILFASFFGFSILDDIEFIKQMMATLQMPEQLNVEQLITMTLVVTYAMTVILEATLLHMFAKVILARFKIAMTPSRPIEKVRLPKAMGWVMLAGMFLYPLAKVLGASEAILTITFTIYAWIVILLLYEAFVFVIIVQRRYKLRFLLMSVVLGLLLIPMIFVDILTIIGLLDILSDIRMRILGVSNHA